MIVKFNYTQTEIVDASKRLLNRSKSIRRARFQGLIVVALLSWLIAFAVFFRHPATGALAGTVLAIFSMILYPSLNAGSMERRLSKIVKEHHGDDNLFVCEVEITPDGFRTSGENIQMLYGWGKVEEISVTPNSVDIFTRTSGVVVRNYAFETAEERQQFIDLATQYLAQARSQKPSQS